MRSPRLAWLLLLAAAACGDDDGGSSGGDAAPPDGGQIPGADAGPAPADAGPPPADAPPPDPSCGVDRICFDVKPVAPGQAIAPGRLAVVWYQLNDDLAPDPPHQLGYDVPFDPAATRIEVPLASITPPGQAYLLCARARGCVDPATCPCMGTPRVGTAAVVVAPDLDGDGALDVAEVESLYGAGYMHVGWSATAHVPAPSPFDQLFPDGIEQGTRPYRVIEGGGGFDRLGLTAPATLFDLNVCPGPPGNGPPCDVPFPNLT